MLRAQTVPLFGRETVGADMPWLAPAMAETLEESC
jgi:hypothetical protein